MILSTGQVLGGLALLAGLYLLWGLPVALMVGGAVLLAVCTLAEYSSAPGARAARVQRAVQRGDE